MPQLTAMRLVQMMVEMNKEHHQQKKHFLFSVYVFFDLQK